MQEITTVDQLFHYIFSASTSQKKRVKKSLSYMRKLCKILKVKPKKMKIIHLSGSKGKGSTACFIAHALHECGYKVGLYTSPHVSSYFERIQIIGKKPNKKRFVNLGRYMQKRIASKRLESTFNFFELLSALGMLYFQQEKCDFVVLETGMGGLLDSTNVFMPIATVQTLIEKEHAHLLGDTVEKIAWQKAGIIKKKVPNFSYTQTRSVESILKAKSHSELTKTQFLNDIIQGVRSHSVFSHTVTYRDGSQKQFETGLLGNHQGKNAILASMVLKSVLKKRYYEKEALIFKGFSYAFLPGRFEIISQSPLIIVDSAHTQASVRESVDALKLQSEGKTVHILFGCGEHKAYGEMLQSLKTLSKEILITKPGYFKKSDLNGVAAEAEQQGFRVSVEASVETACETFLKNPSASDLYYVIGSFFLVDEFKQYLEKNGINSHESQGVVI